MGWDGAGNVNRDTGVFTGTTVWQQSRDAGRKIRADDQDTHDQDLADAIELAVARDGQNSPTADLPMATQKHTNVGNATARNHYAALGQVQDGKANWVDGGGSADAITALYSPAVTTLVDGQEFYVRATAANATTTPTFSPNGLTARTIVKVGGTALAVGDIAGDGHELVLRYDLSNTRYELLNPAHTAFARTILDDADADAVLATISALKDVMTTRGDVVVEGASGPVRLAIGSSGQVLGSDGTDPVWQASGLPRGYMSGYIITNNGTDADHDLDISVGAARNSGDTADVKLTSALTKQMDAAFAEGTNQGGLGDTVSLPASGTLHVFAITKDSDGTVDILGDTSVTGANVPSGWTVGRRIGSWRTDSSNNLLALAVNEMAGGAVLCQIKDPPLDIDISNPGTSAVLRSLSVPNDIQVMSNFNVLVRNGTTATLLVYLSAPDVNDEAPSLTAAPLYNTGRSSSADESASLDISKLTNTSGQIRSRFSASGAADLLKIATLGWVDYRV